MEGHLVPHYHSIGIKGLIMEEEVSIFVDNRVTQSFIDHGFVIKKILPTKMVKKFYVCNANGNYTLCNHLVRNFLEGW